VKTWRLKKGADRRLRQGHPWIFASELAHSAKEISAGELVELQDSNGHFLAYGYGHPSSQIAFRRLSSRSKDKDVLSKEFFIQRLRQARLHRQMTGWSQFSHRWVYAEADGLPGLMLDAFLTASEGWVVVVQTSTAGAERALPALYQALETFAPEFGLLTVIEAPSSKSRALEGLAIKERRKIFGAAEHLERCTILLVNGLKLQCDLLKGQKTGFFLDQQWNTRILREALQNQFAKSERPIRVLDICCYVGQWGAQSALALEDSEVTLVDVSTTALELAKTNVEALGARAQTVCGDALDCLSELEPESFDVVVCDPPAFVKKKADLETGLRAYVKINREAMRLVRPSGLMVASSCSGHVKTADWKQVLLEASQKAGRTYKQFAQGGHAPDHPLRPEFPEGEYLKCTFGRIDYPF
jgi:23S rRNA (cytosine1962-C5)-methyltransferase